MLSTRPLRAAIVVAGYSGPGASAPDSTRCCKRLSSASRGVSAAEQLSPNHRGRCARFVADHRRDSWSVRDKEARGVTALMPPTARRSCRPRRRARYATVCSWASIRALTHGYSTRPLVRPIARESQSQSVRRILRITTMQSSVTLVVAPGGCGKSVISSVRADPELVESCVQPARSGQEARSEHRACSTVCEATWAAG